MNWSAEFIFIKDLIKAHEYKRAQEKIEKCSDEIRHLKTAANRNKVDVINTSIIVIRKEISGIDLLIKEMQLKHSIELLGFEDALNIFKDEFLRLKSEKRKISNHR